MKRLCSLVLCLAIVFSVSFISVKSANAETHLSFFYSYATMEEGLSSGNPALFFANIAAISMKDITEQAFFDDLSHAIDVDKYGFRIFVTHEKNMNDTDLAILFCFKNRSWVLRDMTLLPSLYIDVSLQMEDALNLKGNDKSLVNAGVPNNDSYYECNVQAVWQIFMQFVLYLEERDKAIDELLSSATTDIAPLPTEIEDWPLEVPITINMPKEIKILDVVFLVSPSDKSLFSSDIAIHSLDDIPDSQKFTGTVDKDNRVSGTILVWEAGAHDVVVALTADLNGQRTSLDYSFDLDTSNVVVTDPDLQEELSAMEALTDPGNNMANTLEDITSEQNNRSWKRLLPFAEKRVTGPTFAAKKKIFGGNIHVLDRNDEAEMIKTWKYFLGKTISGYSSVLNESFDADIVDRLHNYSESVNQTGKVLGTGASVVSDLADITQDCIDYYKFSHVLPSKDLQGMAKWNVKYDNIVELNVAKSNAKSVGTIADKVSTVCDWIGYVTDFLDACNAGYEQSKLNDDIYEDIQNAVKEYVQAQIILSEIKEGTEDKALIAACDELSHDITIFYQNSAEDIRAYNDGKSSEVGNAFWDTVGNKVITNIIEKVSPFHLIQHTAGALTDLYMHDTRVFETASNLYTVGVLEEIIHEDTANAVHNEENYYMTELNTVIQLYATSYAVQYMDAVNDASMRKWKSGVKDIDEKKNWMFEEVDKLLAAQEVYKLYCSQLPTNQTN